MPLPTLLERLDDRNDRGELMVLGELRPPRETTVEAVRNRHDPTLTDTLRTLHYDGLRLDVYHVTSSGQQIVESLTVTGEGYDTGLGFGVGASRAEVREAVGEPGRTEDGWSWDLYDGEDDPTPTALRVWFGPDERVERIRWDFYLG